MKFKYERVRKEEIFADQFAIQHASKEALKSIDQDMLSLEGNLKMDDSWLSSMICKLSDYSQIFHNFLDPAHPSNKERSVMVHKGIKDRFGNTDEK